MTLGSVASSGNPMVQSISYRGQPDFDAAAISDSGFSEWAADSSNSGNRLSPARSAAAQPAHVNMEALAEWLLTCSLESEALLHPTVKTLIDACRQEVPPAVTEDRSQAHFDFIKKISMLESSVLTGIFSAFNEKNLEALQPINREIALRIDALRPHRSDQTATQRTDAVVAVAVDEMIEQALRARGVSAEQAKTLPWPDKRGALQLAGRDAITVGLTTLLREGIRALLNTASAQGLSEGSRIALALTPTTLSVLLVSKDIYAHANKTGRWADSPQVCRMLLAVSAVTTPALLLALGKSPSLAASFNSTLPTFAYTASRDVLQTYLPAGKSWQKNMLGIMAITTGYAGAQMAFSKVMGALADGLATLQLHETETQIGANSTVVVPYATLSEADVERVEAVCCTSLAPSGWDIATLALATSAINWGVEYFDNLCRPPLYWAGEKVAHFAARFDDKSGPTIATATETETETARATHTSTSIASPTFRRDVYSPSLFDSDVSLIQTNSARVTPSGSAEQAMTPARPPSLALRAWDNDGRRSCTFLGIVGLLGVADQYSTNQGHDLVTRAMVQDVALVASMLLMAGLYAGAQNDARPDAAPSQPNSTERADVFEITGGEGMFDDDSGIAEAPSNWGSSAISYV